MTEHIPQQRRPPGHDECRCGEAIRLRNWQLGPTWVHQCGSNICADGVSRAVPVGVAVRTT